MRGQAKAWEEGPSPAPRRNWAGEQAWPTGPSLEPRRHSDSVRGEDTLSCTLPRVLGALHVGCSRRGAPPRPICLNQTGLSAHRLGCLFTPKSLSADNRSDHVDLKSRKIRTRPSQVTATYYEARWVSPARTADDRAEFHTGRAARTSGARRGPSRCFQTAECPQCCAAAACDGCGGARVERGAASHVTEAAGEPAGLRSAPADGLLRSGHLSRSPSSVLTLSESI